MGNIYMLFLDSDANFKRLFTYRSIIQILPVSAIVQNPIPQANP